MAVMALLLAVSGPREIRGLEARPLIQAAFTAFGVFQALVASIAITIVLFGFWWRRQGQIFFDQPGHWLLVGIAVQQTLFLVMALLISLAARFQGIDRADAWSQVPLKLTWLGPAVVIAILYVYVARKKCAESRWRRVFYASAISEVVPVLGHMLLLILLERAVRAERVRRAVSSRWARARGVQPLTEGQVVTPPRDFAHWCGVAATFFQGGVVISIVIGVISYLIFMTMY
jgi:hypothetical protein